jgi:hypothetical protein
MDNRRIPSPWRAVPAEHTLPAVARRRRPAPRDDLFSIFPSLPFVPPRSREAQVARMRQLLSATRDRARASIARQREATARVRARVAARKIRSR